MLDKKELDTNKEHLEKEVIKEFMNKQADWEDEWSKHWHERGADYEEIKSFIKELRIKERSKDRDTLIEKIEKERKGKFGEDIFIQNWNEGFNSALDYVKQIILETIK